MLRADRIEQREGEFCAVSEDGRRSFGCYATEEEAAERLRQVEAAVAAKGDSVFRVDRLGPVHTDPARTDGVLAELTPEGFLRCSSLLTRTGVFEYCDADGNTWGEYRDAEEVFEPESLDSFRMVVVTDDHPAEMVTADNVKDVQVGHVGSDVRRDGDFVRASLVITDPEVIRSIQDGKVELSCGYFAQVIQDAGVAPDGTPFTSRQTNIRGNHLALVEQGRAGPSCRLLLDAGDAITKQDIMPKKKTKQSKVRKDAKVIVGGVEFDVPEEVAEAIGEMGEKVEKQAAELARLKEPAAEEPAAEAGAEAETDMVETETVEAEVTTTEEAPAAEDADDQPKTDEKEKAMFDALKAQIDRLEAKNDSLEAKLENANKGQDTRIDARVNLVATCRSILGDSFKTDGVPEIDLQKAVVAKARGWDAKKLDGKSAEYISAAYELAVEDEASRVDSSGALLELTSPTNVVEVEDGDAKLDAAHSEMLNRLANNYRKPATTEIH